VGPLFAFTLLGYFLQLKSHGVGVAVLFVAGLVALGSLSSQRRNRARGPVNHWGFDELLITAGYGLLAVTAPLVVGLYGGHHELSGDPFRIGWAGLASLCAVLCAVVVLLAGSRGVKAASRTEGALGVVSLFLVALGLVVVLAVIMQGGLNGNHIGYLTFQGASWSAIAAGIAIAVPFFYGADFSVTQSTELGEDARRWSRPNLIMLIGFLALLQYSGAIGTSVLWPDIPAFSPLANIYVGGSVRGVAWLLVVVSGVVYSSLLAVLFSRRLAAHRVSLRARVLIIAGLTALVIIAANNFFKGVANSSDGDAMSIFLNVSSVGGSLLVAGLAASCVRAMLLTRALKMGAMEFLPSIVGLLGLSLAFYGYFWQGITSVPMARGQFAIIVGVVITGIAFVSWQRSLRFSAQAQ
jgi:hypothetical protein